MRSNRTWTTDWKFHWCNKSSEQIRSRYLYPSQTRNSRLNSFHHNYSHQWPIISVNTCIIMNNLQSRREIQENGPDSAEIPRVYEDTVVAQYWKERIVQGKPTSIIHPRIREEIVWLIEAVINRSTEFHQASCLGSTCFRIMYVLPSLQTLSDSFLVLVHCFSTGISGYFLLSLVVYPCFCCPVFYSCMFYVNLSFRQITM